MNLANQITMSRLVLACIIFVLLSLLPSKEMHPTQYTFFLDISLALFIIAAVSDILDGYIARKYNLVSSLGRIADPLVDKIITGGIFIFLIRLTPIVDPWMVVVVIGREMLVSGIRSHMEQHGIAFGANWGGKFKMALQCLTVGFFLGYLAHFQEVRFLFYFASFLLWLTLLVTVVSSFSYIRKAYLVLKERKGN